MTGSVEFQTRNAKDSLRNHVDPDFCELAKTLTSVTTSNRRDPLCAPLFSPPVGGVVAYAHGPAVSERILEELQPYVPAQLLPAFRYCLEHPEHPLSVEQVAAACGIKRRALEYRFGKAGLPGPAGCFARCRLLLAVHHLEHQTDSIERIALDHAFATAGALRKSAVRHLGMKVISLRSKGAFERALAGFIDDIREGTRALCGH